MNEVRHADAVVSIERDAAGRTTRIEDSQSGPVEWSYDEANRVLSETTPAGVVEYGYNAADQLSSMTARPTGRGARTPVEYGHDAAGRLSTIGQGVEVFTYVWDALSRIESIARPNGARTLFEFDAADRLSRMRHVDAADQAIEDYRYGYTRDDEIESIESLASATLLPAAAEASAADEANRIGQFGGATYGFDAEGQTTGRTDAGGETRYEWDSRGRMTAAVLADGRRVEYGHDALGRRASRTFEGATTGFLYDGADVVVDVESGGGEVDYLNGPGIDDKLRMADAGGALYFLQDHLGSTAALVDASGAVVERRNYEAFGASPVGSRTRYGFTGREEDEATGLMYYRARWYDPEQGRFLTEDPIGFAGGLNARAYADNDPIGARDPMGLDTQYEHRLQEMFASHNSLPRATRAEAQMMLDAASMAPVVGIPADIASAIMSACDGDWVGVGLSAGGLFFEGVSAAKFTRSLAKTADRCPKGVEPLYRGDRASRTPEVVFHEGFSPKGTNTDLLTHASTNGAGSIYVPTSRSFDIAEQFAGKNGFVWDIRTSRGIDVNQVLGPKSPYPEQLDDWHSKMPRCHG